MNKKGISSVTLAITVVVLLMLVSLVSISLTYSIENAKKMVFAKEIYNIQSIVTEYIKKENALQVKGSIQIEISGTNQFNGETISNGNVVLNVLDLAEMDIKNTNYGNGSLGEKDVYAVSQLTGKVYYIAGFETNNGKYYTLTDELLNMIEKKQNLNVVESTILFIPDIIGWTNQGVHVKISVPNDYIINSVTTDNADILCTTEVDSGVEYWSVNKDKIAQKYTITVEYIKNGVPGTISYTTKFDNVAPSISKDTNIINTTKSIKGINAIDDGSGIKYFKYVEGIILNDNNTATYMTEFGKNVKNGTLKSKNKVIYTLYAEDKAGNYRLIHIDEEGMPAQLTLESATSTSEFVINEGYGLGLVDYKLYGNSVQDGTPSLDTPVSIESVGDYDSETGKYVIPIRVAGKNLLNNNISSTSTGLYRYNKFIENDLLCTISISDKDTSVDITGIYVGISYTGANADTAFNWLVNNGRLLRPKIQNDKDIHSEALPDMMKYFSVHPNSEETWEKVFDRFYIQVEYGSEVTEYEPYVEPAYFNIYLDEPLRKIGDYVDYIDFKTGTVVRNVEVVDDTGTLTLEESLRGKSTTTQKIELPKVQLRSGTNIIEPSTKIMPSSMNISYYKKVIQ